MGIICDTCGRDIDALGQDNMGVDAPLWAEELAKILREVMQPALRMAVR